MKKLLFLLFLITGFTELKGQYAYYDATALRQLLNSNGKWSDNDATKRDVNGILSKYCPLADIDDIFIDNNPFIKDYALNWANKSGRQSNPSAILSSVGNLNVTNFVDGLAKFLVQRSKEELNIVFFRNFQKYLTANPEIEIMFPSTGQIVNTLAAYNYAAMLPALRVSFHKDLNNFSTNLLKLRDVANYKGYPNPPALKNRVDAIVSSLNTTNGRSVSSAILATEGLIKGKNAAEIISTLSNDQVLANDNLSNSLRFVNLISESLRSNDNGRVWITAEQVNALVKDQVTLQIFFGLIYAKNQLKDQIKFSFDGSTLELNTFLTDLKTKWDNKEGQDFISGFQAIALKASEVTDYAKAIKEPDQNESPIMQYGQYTSALAALLKLAVTVLPKNGGINSLTASLGNDVAKFASVIETAADCSYDIKSKNYTSLVFHSSLLINDLLPSESVEVKQRYLKYGTFMASIVEASNSDDVKTAIEASVLPAGSSSIKRETNTNISLNAFLGGFAGSEYLAKLKEDQRAFASGLSAPVGVAFSWGIGKSSDAKKKVKVRTGESFSVFLPIIDIGAMASFRAANDSSKVASEVSLKNIISPGLYLIYGLKRLPVSVGIGAQAGPQLREVTARPANTNINKNFYTRYGITVSVDIPLLNLYTKD